MFLKTFSVVYTDFSDGGGGPGSNGGGVLFNIGEIKNFAFFQTRKFSKNVKKAMKKYYFLKNLKGILQFFENVNEIFAKI